MEMNKSIFSKEYWRYIIVAIYTFFYMFFYSLFYPEEARRSQNGNVRGFGGRGGSQFQSGMRFGGGGG